MSATFNNSAATGSSAAALLNKELRVEHRGRILFLQINRPEKRNALSRRGYYELIRAIDEVKSNAHISLVVLTGVGDYFCAGVDLAQSHHYANANAFYKSANPVLRQLVKTVIYCPKVLVALVNGPCLGVGVTLAGLFDVVYCTDTAHFEAPFTRIGLCPELCSSYTFPLIMGRAKASELLLFGERMSAETALQFNFVAGVYKQQEVQTVLWPKLMQYAELPVESMRISKKLLRTPERESMLRALYAECEQLAYLRFAPTYQEALKSFLNKGRTNKSKL